MRSSLRVADGRLLVGTDAGRLHALGPSRGEELWGHRAAGPVRGRPAVAGDRVVVGSDGGRLDALGLDDGAERWTAPDVGPVRGGPVAADGRVYAGDADGRLHALDAASGEPAWRRDAGAPVVAVPAVAGDAVYVPAGDALVAYSTDGDVRWRRSLDGEAWSPVVRDGTVLVPTAAGGFRAFSPGGAERWRLDVGERVTGDLRAAAGRCFLPAGREVVAVAAGDPAVAWRYGADGEVRSRPVVPDGVAVVGTEAGGVRGVGTADGELSGAVDVGAAVVCDPATTTELQPGLGRALVYFGDVGGRVYAYGFDQFVADPPTVPGQGTTTAADTTGGE